MFVKGTAKRYFQDRTPSQDAVPGNYSKFERYALIQEHLGAGPFDLGEYYLRASWSSSGSDRCRSIALARFKDALEQSGPTAEIEAPLAAYLAGEMARKLGEKIESIRLFREASNLAKSRPELDILCQLLSIQSDEPVDEIIAHFDEFVLDPLSYYHCLIFLGSAYNLKTSIPQRSFQLFRRVYAIASPALERYISKQVPYLPLAHDSKEPLKSSMSRMFMENPNNPTMWVDRPLINIAKGALEAMNELASEAGSLEESAWIKRTNHMVSSRLQVLGPPNEKVIERKL